MTSVFERDAAWRVVAEREVRAKLHDKTFLGSTAVMVVIVIAVFVIAAVVGSSSTTYDVAVVGDRAQAVADATGAGLEAQDDGTVDVTHASTVADAEKSVRDGDVDAALVSTDDGLVLVGDDGVEDGLTAAVGAAAYQTALADNAHDAGVDVADLTAGAAVSERLLDPDADETAVRKGIAFGFAILFYITALSFGMMISQSVVQEKESRVVEILAAAVPIRAMLWGKILGNTVLGVAQVALISVVGLLGLLVTGRTELFAGVGPAVAWYVAFFVLGFVALASLWSVAGALATRQQDLQATTLPGQVLLFAPYIAAVTAGPKVEAVMSMLPIVSTMIMPGRMAKGDVPFWQVLVAIAVTVAAAVLFVRLGTRMYERALLQTGRRMSYREALTSSQD